MKNYICKISTIEEMNKKWDYEISIAAKKENWIIWKEQNIKNYRNGKIIPYYGIINDQIICEATAVLTSDIVQNSNKLVDDTIAYLTDFRTNKEIFVKCILHFRGVFYKKSLKNMSV